LRNGGEVNAAISDMICQFRMWGGRMHGMAATLVPLDSVSRGNLKEQSRQPSEGIAPDQIQLRYLVCRCGSPLTIGLKAKPEFPWMPRV